MAYQTLKVGLIEQHLLRIELNRPDKLNALNEVLLRELRDVLQSAKQNAVIKGILLIGAGKAFCAGADIQRLAELDVISGQAFAEQGQAVFRLLETLGKPSLAAINGFAFGGGCELAMSATLRIASTKAQFGQPEVKLGVIPGYGGTQRLARLVGKGRALDLCLTGRFISANEGLAWGLVSEVVPDDQLEPTAIRILNQITNMAPLALQSVIEVIDKGYDLPLEEALHLEVMHFAKCCATSDKREGVSAFLEKRSPAFKGK